MAFMVEDFGYSGERLGYYVGGLAAAFCSAQFFSSVFWGKVSDIYGRKPAILIGTIGTVFGMLVFGLAKSYPQAILGRVIAGLLSGNIGVLKTYITEITDDSNRAAGFSYLSIAWACGCIIAPLFGGVLSKPVEKYPKFFKAGGFFDIYPYFLPILLCIILLIFSIIMCILFMKETRGQSVISSHTVADPDRGIKYSPVKSSRKESLTNDSEHDGISMTNMTPNTDVKEWSRKDIQLRADGAVEPNAIEENDSDEDECFLCTSRANNVTQQDNESTLPTGAAGFISSPMHAFHSIKSSVLSVTGGNSSSSSSSGGGKSRDNRNTVEYEQVSLELDKSSHFVIEDNCDEPSTDYDGFENSTEVNIDVESPYSSTHVVSFEDDDINVESTTTTTIKIGSNDYLTEGGEMRRTTATTPKRKKNVLRQRVVILACCNYMVLCMAFILFDETLPLFLKLSINEGGFSFDSMNIGTLLSATGVFLLFFAYFVLPKVGRHSKKLLFHYSLFMVLIHVFFWPMCGLFHRHLLRIYSQHTANMIVYPMLFLLLSTKTALASIAFMSSTIQVNHSVHGEDLGMVNGFGQALGAFARGIGPALGGVLWSMSTKYHFVYMNFIAVALLWIINMYVNSVLPLSLDMKKKRKGETLANNDTKEDVMEAGEEITVEF